MTNSYEEVAEKIAMRMADRIAERLRGFAAPDRNYREEAKAAVEPFGSRPAYWRARELHQLDLDEGRTTAEWHRLSRSITEGYERAAVTAIEAGKFHKPVSPEHFELTESFKSRGYPLGPIDLKSRFNVRRAMALIRRDEGEGTEEFAVSMVFESMNAAKLFVKALKDGAVDSLISDTARRDYTGHPELAAAQAIYAADVKAELRRNVPFAELEPEVAHYYLGRAKSDSSSSIHSGKD